MHANLPRIAKRWERDYANGGIMRIPLGTGGFPDFFQMNPENIATARNTSWPNAIKQDWGAGWRRNPANVAQGSRVGARSYINQGINSLRGKFNPGSNVGGATNLMRKVALGAKNVLPRLLSKAALPLELLRATPANADEVNMTEQDWENLRSGNMTPDDITKDMQYDWEGNFRGSNRPGWWGKREFNPVKYNQMKDYFNRANYPRVAEDTSDLSGMADVGTSTAQQFANLGRPHKDFEEMDPARPQRKGFLDTVRGGITNVLDNTVIGKIAALNNPFNPRAANYQPGFRESVDQYRKQGLVSPGGKVMSGPMQGYNMVSGFGSNNYRNMISNRMNKQGMFGLRGPNNEIRNQQKYNQLKAELQKETQRQNNQIAPGSGMSYNQVVNNMVQDRSPERRGKPGGIGGKELMAQGGIASLWPR